MVPPPYKASKEGALTVLPKDHSLALSRETAAQPPCPGCLSPTAALPGEDPKLHFAEEESDVWLLDRWLQEGLDAALSRCSVRAN